MFYSILFPSEEQHERKREDRAPDCFGDLNLSRIFSPLLESVREYALDSFFYTPLQDADVVLYRQGVTEDLEENGLRALLAGFSRSICRIARLMSGVQKAAAPGNGHGGDYLTKGQLLDGAEQYCSGVVRLAKGLKNAEFCSEGLRNFAEYLNGYAASEAFIRLRAHAAGLRAKLSSVEYCMLIRDGVIRVRKYEGEAYLGTDVLKLFDRFRTGEAKDYRHELTDEPRSRHVEAAVLDLVASCYRDIFSELDDFCLKHPHFIDAALARFSREIQFYIAWLEYIRPLRAKGLSFCYPKLCPATGHLYGRDGFDLALALSLPQNGKPVTNDFALDPPERIIVVTGPNQGGKTTFARAFGQIHYLNSLGLCVPGRDASLCLFDHIFTHFGREEKLSTPNGRLEDDLERLHDLLKRATPRSIFIVNEIFASATFPDALLLGNHMMDAIERLGGPAVCVTFLDELAAHSEKMVSMMSTVREDDPAARTFKILRKPPDGLAYALVLAGRHGLTYDQLCGRLRK